MRLTYSEGFHLDERKEVRQAVFSNIIVAFQLVFAEMKEMGLQFEDGSLVSCGLLDLGYVGTHSYGSSVGTSEHYKSPRTSAWEIVFHEIA